jgi:hypothetical protein
MDKLLKLIAEKARGVDESLKGDEHITEAQLAARADAAASELLGAAIHTLREDLNAAIRSQMKAKAVGAKAAKVAA